MKPANQTPELTHDRLAHEFDALMNPYDIRRRLQVLVDEFLGAVELRQKLVLDAGCGTGRATERLTQRGASVVALDLGFQLVNRTRARVRCAPVLGSVLACPFPPDSFDIVFSTEVIEHTPAPLDAVSELCRLVKPGGYLVLSTPNWLWQFPVRLASRFRWRPYDGLENFVKPPALRRRVETSRFRVLRHTGIHLLPFQLSALHPVLEYADRYGSALLPIMIGQCLLAQKRDH